MAVCILVNISTCTLYRISSKPQSLIIGAGLVPTIDNISGLITIFIKARAIMETVHNISGIKFDVQAHYSTIIISVCTRGTNVGTYAHIT